MFSDDRVLHFLVIFADDKRKAVLIRGLETNVGCNGICPIPFSIPQKNTGKYR